MIAIDETCFPIAKLPNELVNGIFGYSHQSELFALCQVSKWVGRMAYPHLYSTPIIKKLSSAYQFLDCLRKNTSTLVDPREQDAPRPRSVVHNLWIEAVSEAILHIIKLCDNLDNIALHAEALLWLTTMSNHAVQQRKRNAHVTIIKSINWSFYPYFNMSIPRPVTANPLLCTITHLRITELGGFSRSIEFFPRLSHLAASYYHVSQIETDLTKIVEHPSLEALVVVPITDLAEEHREPLEDWAGRMGRVKPELHVSIVDTTTDGLQGEWEVGGLLCLRCDSQKK